MTLQLSPLAPPQPIPESITSPIQSLPLVSLGPPICRQPSLSQSLLLKVPLCIGQPLLPHISSGQRQRTLVFLQRWFTQAAQIDVRLTTTGQLSVDVVREIYKELVHEWLVNRPRTLVDMDLTSFVRLIAGQQPTATANNAPFNVNQALNGMRLSPRFLALLVQISQARGDASPSATDIDALCQQIVQSSNSYAPTTHTTRWAAIQQVLALAIQLNGDLALPTHKYIAHQLALLYQAVGALGTQCTLAPYKDDIERHFDVVKEQLREPRTDPVLSGSEQAWLYQLTNDLVKCVLQLDRSVCGEKVSGFVHAIGPYLHGGSATN